MSRATRTRERLPQSLAFPHFSSNKIMEPIHDVRCVTCDYILCDPCPSERCPECGTAIAESIAAHERLKVPFSPTQLNDIRIGIVILISTAIAYAAVFVFGLFLAEMGQKPVAGTIYRWAVTLIAIVGVWGTRKCASGRSVALALAFFAVLVARTILVYANVLPWANPYSASACSVLFALAAGSVLYDLSSLGKPYERLERSSHLAWRAYLIVGATAAFLAVTNQPTAIAGRGLLLLSDFGIGVATIVILAYFFRGMRRVIPRIEQDC